MTPPHVAADLVVYVPEPLPGRGDPDDSAVVIDGPLDLAAAAGAGSTATVAERLAAIEASTARRRANLAPSNTEKTRRNAWACWERFSTAAELPVQSVAAGTLLLFAEWMNSNGMAASTMRTYVACVVVEARSYYPTKEEGLRQLPQGFAADVFQAIEHMSKTAANRQERRGRGKSLAVNPPSLRAVVSSLDTSRRIGLRDKAMLLMWYALGARGAEIAHLAIDDVELTIDDGDRPGMYLHLTATKTGDRRPFVPYDDVEPHLCPVRAWLAWLDSLRQTPHSRAAFPQLTRHDTVKAESLTPDGVRKRLGLLFTQAGEAFSGGHGMRRGHIQNAERMGYPPEDVRQHVGLAHNSTAWYAYVEAWDSRRKSTAAGIMRAQQAQPPTFPEGRPWTPNRH